MFRQLCVVIFLLSFPVLFGTHHMFFFELRVDFIHAAAQLDRSSFCCLSNFEIMEFRVTETTGGFMSSCCLVCGGSQCNSSRVWRSSNLHTKNNMSKRREFEVTHNTCPVLSMENTVSTHVTVGTTQNIVDIPTVQELVS